jgi:hypothetical protein
VVQVIRGGPFSRKLITSFSIGRCFSTRPASYALVSKKSARGQGALIGWPLEWSDWVSRRTTASKSTDVAKEGSSWQGE